MSCLTILGVEMQAVEVDAQRQQHTQANLDETDRQTDGRTPDSCIDPALHTMQAVATTYSASSSGGKVGLSSYAGNTQTANHYD